jgi:hypothetical protein
MITVFVTDDNQKDNNTTSKNLKNLKYVNVTNKFNHEMDHYIRFLKETRQESNGCKTNFSEIHNKSLHHIF